MLKKQINHPYQSLQQGFMEHLKVLHRAKDTLRTYVPALNMFFDYLQKNNIIDIRQVDKHTIFGYRQYLTEYTFIDQQTKQPKHYDPTVICIRLRALKRFFEYLEDNQTILINPIENLKMPKVPKRLPERIISKEDIKKVLAQPNTSSFIGIRDKAILELLYSTGIRLGELCALTIYDVDYIGGFLRVTKGKMAKDRVVPIGKYCCKYLSEYVRRVRPIFLKDKDCRTFFIGKLGARIDRKMVNILVKEYGKKAGIKKRVTPHVFRHSLASHMLLGGADILQIKKILGHRDLKSTQIYLKVTPIEVREALNKHHPRKSFKL